MATYLELHALRSDSDLQDKVVVAVAKKAQLLLDGATPTTAQVTWAKGALQNPRGTMDYLLNYVLAANSEATSAQISGATDADIQTAVNGAVDAIIAGSV